MRADDTPDEPRWLDADEQRAWLALARLLVRLPALLSAQLQHDSDLTHFEYTVLTCLSEADDRTLRMSELAQLSEGSLSRLSQVVGKLEQRGWVIRRRSRDDRRAILATLTDAGMEAVVAAAPGHVNAVHQLVIDPLTPEQLEHLRSACVSIMKAAEGELPWFPGIDHGRHAGTGSNGGAAEEELRSEDAETA
ncbi:MarR family winged helix-turn-helix transcriptional regulator [Aestuariimicrobium kwangyangense]|uniref:MarR family winged helix-turn-helix transcriptional regulator n=1 Tax=Aestuariimicrobium kwangyangense TaxID=396389 RepID=UPI0003B36944|nr:MarR family transcriptional regulator [Aestuariimicrobium kwangyangense]